MQSASKLPKAPQIGTFFGFTAVFVTQQASVAAVLPRIRLCTRLPICSTAHRPRVRPHVPAVQTAVYSFTYMFNRTSAAGSAARPGCVNGCVLVYLYVQPHIGRDSAAIRPHIGRALVRALVRALAVRSATCSVAYPSAHSTCVSSVRSRCASKRTFNLCVVRAFRCAPNHTARPRNRPQLWQKVRSPGR